MAVRALVADPLQPGFVKNLPKKPIGHGPQAQFMSELLDCMEERTPLKTDLYELDQTTKGWRIKPGRNRGGSGSLEQRMIIKEIHDDWFLCLPYDKDGQHPAADVATTADYIKVAKPYELRLTPWDGQTVDGITFDYSDESHRTATQGAIIEQHVIVRPWYVGEIIVAATQITGGTDQEDFAAKALEWEDTNSASHAWAMVDINDTGGITPQSLNVRSVSGLFPILSSGGTRPIISLDPSFTGATGLDDPTALVGPVAVNGSATTAMRSDAAPAIDETADYDWAGHHIFRDDVMIGFEPTWWSPFSPSFLLFSNTDHGYSGAWELFAGGGSDTTGDNWSFDAYGDDTQVNAVVGGPTAYVNLYANYSDSGNAGIEISTGSTKRTYITPWVASGNGSAAYYFDTQHTLAGGSDFLQFWLNHGSLKASIDKDGAVTVGSVTKVQKTAIIPANGMIVYQSDNTPGFRGYVNGTWFIFSMAADP